MKTYSAGVVVLNPGRKVLLVEQSGHVWSLPKGHIDAGEDAVAAAKRELAEETGVTEAALIMELGSYERYKIGLRQIDDISELKHIRMFLFETAQEDLKPSDVSILRAEWVERDKVVDRLTHPRDKDFFRSVLARI